MAVAMVPASPRHRSDGILVLLDPPVARTTCGVSPSTDGVQAPTAVGRHSIVSVNSMPASIERRSGQALATFSRRWSCASLRSPPSSIATPKLPRGRACGRSRRAPSLGRAPSFFVRAYMTSVVEMLAASAAGNNSCGAGPLPSPPSLDRLVGVDQVPAVDQDLLPESAVDGAGCRGETHGSGETRRTSDRRHPGRHGAARGEIRSRTAHIDVLRH